MTKYIYCGAHGRVHVQRGNESQVWCTAAQSGGLEFYYAAHMQQYANWDDVHTLRFAEQQLKEMGLWFFDPSKDWKK